MARVRPSTYSIVACDLERAEWGVAVQSKFLAVGSLVTWAEPHVGAIATQGNILVSEATVDALAATFEGTSGKPLADRLLESLAAAQLAGGDRRGQQSAALFVVRKDGGYGELSDVMVDLRVDDHERPIDELARIFGIHQLLFGETPDDEWLDVDEDVETELRERLARLGYEQESLDAAFSAWAGAENLQGRGRGLDRIDPVVLAELRKR